MKFIKTTIRLRQEDYDRFIREANIKKTNLSFIIREKLGYKQPEKYNITKYNKS